ncbi:DUF4823 domain-containing protein [Pseudomonas panipatensis]|jgi:hypothetical protein|uniref:DUF4823 domain-containing protein n=1 Tax=Pseudomonas panipatensis TaxID=428992 RepID=A0A1G8CJA1_9PSED|nr:DUF4823 domain-containing protein [Pseudomonas panipatensis]SDH45536.1 protein of unknown function [Pseudomonas panipatensis]SMP64567.1 protein of unknown function [Pseudomonas panipatensis]
MRYLLLILALVALAGCMKPSDMAERTGYYFGDAGFLDHSQTRRTGNWRLQADSFIYIAQGPFVPPGHPYARPNVVAEETFNGFVEYFPQVRRAKTPLGLDGAMQEARAAGADYLLYTRFARGEDNVGNWEEYQDTDNAVGRDRSVVQVMLIQTSNRYLVDSATIRSRGGFLTFYDAKPEDLLGPPLEEYARSLLGVRATEEFQ